MPRKKKAAPKATRVRGPIPTRTEPPRAARPARRSLIAAGKLAAPTMADTLGRPRVMGTLPTQTLGGLGRPAPRKSSVSPVRTGLFAAKTRRRKDT